MNLTQKAAVKVEGKINNDSNVKILGTKTNLNYLEIFLS